MSLKAHPACSCHARVDAQKPNPSRLMKLSASNPQPVNQKNEAAGPAALAVAVAALPEAAHDGNSGRVPKHVAQEIDRVVG